MFFLGWLTPLTSSMNRIVLSGQEIRAGLIIDINAFENWTLALGWIAFCHLIRVSVCYILDPGVGKRVLANAPSRAVTAGGSFATRTQFEDRLLYLGKTKRVECCTLSFLWINPLGFFFGWYSKCIHSLFTEYFYKQNLNDLIKHIHLTAPSNLTDSISASSIEQNNLGTR